MMKRPVSGMQGIVFASLLAAALAVAQGTAAPARADAAATLKSTEACYDDSASDEETIGCPCSKSDSAMESVCR